MHSLSSLWCAFRLRTSKVLLIGLNGLGAEICKNIVLCGVKSLTLLDHQVVTKQDFTAQFLIPRVHLGKNVCVIFFCLRFCPKSF